MKLCDLAKLVFWGSTLTLAYTFAGYGSLMRALARKAPSHELPETEDAALPRVTVVLIVHNEESRVVARISNLLASDYPADRLEVLLVSDGSTDATVAQAQSLPDPRVVILSRHVRSGKAACINAALRHISAEVVVFCDARKRFASDTIRRLAAWFSHADVGAVGGSLEVEGGHISVGRGAQTYRQIENEVRTAEAKWNSAIGCTGAVYAIRRSLFTPIQEDTILEHVVIPMKIATQGFRVMHDPQALAFDAQPLGEAGEERRRRRTFAGTFQMLFRYPEWLRPTGNRLWWQLLSHRYLQLAAPIPLALLIVSNVLLVQRPLFRMAMVAQAIFYGLAATGIAAPGFRTRLVVIPAGFVSMNIAVVRAFAHYLRSRDTHRWDPGDDAEASPFPRSFRI